MTENSAPFEAHRWLEDHALAMRAVEVGQIGQAELVPVRMPIWVRSEGVLMTTFYRLPDGWTSPR
ncbi:hypothetical protein ACIGXM_12935 [Kitasatospora sp. NPDC052896]|uniref:hypothetical protein n=1 Tax=Kitasatospora sp. NPDC052896 TaxID=3364061 RepID=UPI0037C9538C